MSMQAALLACRRLMLGGILLSILASLAQGDYVETAPRPGAPPPPAIPLGQCPLDFPKSDIQQVTQTACLYNTASIVAASNKSPTTCCGQIVALLFAARVRYANDVGRLLLPQASADACIQSFNKLLTAAGIPFLKECGITSEPLSEATGLPCGGELTTVYDFWSATNHTFPGTMVYGCGNGATSITDKILSIGASTTALLNTSTCQDLAHVAMTAAAYPLVIANCISQSLYATDIAPVQFASKCTDFNWRAANLTSVFLSCGPEQIEDRNNLNRCCNLINGAFGQQAALLYNRTGRPLDQGQVGVCADEFEAILDSHGIHWWTLSTCYMIPALDCIGCYNYTTAVQKVPSQYLDKISAVCAAAQDCSACQPTLYAAALELANTTDVDYVSPCLAIIMLQSCARFSTIKEITAWLNCYYQFPPGLELGLPIMEESNSLSVGAIAGICSAVAVCLLVATVVLAFVTRKKGYPGRQLATLSRITSLRLRAQQKRLRLLSEKQLVKATRNFDESRLLGSGGSGRVYLGELNGELVAIKRATIKVNKNGVKEARNEIATLAMYRHRHLVFLKGCSLLGPQCRKVNQTSNALNLLDLLYEESF